MILNSLHSDDVSHTNGAEWSRTYPSHQNYHTESRPCISYSVRKPIILFRGDPLILHPLVSHSTILNSENEEYLLSQIRWVFCSTTNHYVSSVAFHHFRYYSWETKIFQEEDVISFRWVP